MEHRLIMSHNASNSVSFNLRHIKKVPGTIRGGAGVCGGRDYMFDPSSEGQVWASFPPVVNSLQKRAAALKGSRSSGHGSTRRRKG